MFDTICFLTVETRSRKTKRARFGSASGEWFQGLSMESRECGWAGSAFFESGRVWATETRVYQELFRLMPFLSSTSRWRESHLRLAVAHKLPNPALEGGRSPAARVGQRENRASRKSVFIA